MHTITKTSENEATFIKEVVEVRDYETLISQKAGILAQQEAEEARLVENNAMRAVELANIEEALATGIKARPAAVV